MGWGTGNLGGGSGGLNFKIVSYATESELLADTPKENTIGVITSIPITGYHFGTEEPSPAAAGMVWITTGTRSPVEFNALKKNAIQVYPISAKQYISGAWVDKVAKSYQGGAWVDWMTEGALYYDGDELTAKTGGWKAVSGTITKNADYFVVNKNSVVSTTNKISTVGYKTITVKALASGVTQWFGFGNTNNAFAVGQVELPTGSVGEVSIDLTSIQGSYYPIFAANSSNTINVYRVVMRK